MKRFNKIDVSEIPNFQNKEETALFIEFVCDKAIKRFIQHKTSKNRRI